MRIRQEDIVRALRTRMKALGVRLMRPRIRIYVHWDDKYGMQFTIGPKEAKRGLE
jgi:hypothetical protein